MPIVLTVGEAWAPWGLEVSWHSPVGVLNNKKWSWMGGGLMRGRYSDLSSCVWTEYHTISLTVCLNKRWRLFVQFC